MAVDTTPFIQEYKRLVKEKYNLELSGEYATECFFALVSLLEAVYSQVGKESKTLDFANNRK